MEVVRTNSNSHFCNWCSQYPNGDVWARRCGRCIECNRMGRTEYVYVLISDALPRSNQLTCMLDFAIVQGNFRNSHAHCHSIADMAQVVGGPILKELCGGLFIIAYVLCSGSGIVGLSVGFNALSDHAACTVWWAFLAFVLVVACASVRKFEKIGWLSVSP